MKTPHIHTKATPPTQRARPAGPNAMTARPPFYNIALADVPIIQPKLTIGQPNDKYEQEADRIADQVVARTEQPAPSVQKKCADCEEKEQANATKAIQTKPLAAEITPLIQRQGEEEYLESRPTEDDPISTEAEDTDEEASASEETSEPIESVPTRDAGEMEDERISPKTQVGGSPQYASSSLTSRLHSTKGSGQPLSRSTRTQMETAFGTSFSGVRIHTDQPAIQMNKELNAQAFTHGRDIYFGEGKFQPETREGRKLLAHELVHVGAAEREYWD